MVSLVSAICGDSGQPGQQSPQKKTDPIWCIHLICGVLASSVTPLIRTGFGMEGLGLPGFLSGVLLFVLAGADPLMAYWLIAWAVAVVVQRVVTFRNVKRGLIVHTRFGGRSLLLKIPLLRNVRFIEGFEVLLCLLLAGLMSFFSPRGGVPGALFRRHSGSLWD